MDELQENRDENDVLVACAVRLALAVPALAQVSSGIIAGTIKDEQGGVLPGVSVTLSGADRSAAFTTETDGRFRFLNLPPGTYTVSAELPGFSKIVREDLTVVGRIESRPDVHDEGRDGPGDHHRQR